MISQQKAAKWLNRLLREVFPYNRTKELDKASIKKVTSFLESADADAMSAISASLIGRNKQLVVSMLSQVGSASVSTLTYALSDPNPEIRVAALRL